MDIFKLASKIQNMPDDQLSFMMENPGEAPDWLVASELQRRERLRSTAQPTENPVSTVVDDIRSTIQQRYQPQPQMFNEGGAVSASPASVFAPNSMVQGGQFTAADFYNSAPSTSVNPFASYEKLRQSTVEQNHGFRHPSQTYNNEENQQSGSENSGAFGGALYNLLFGKFGKKYAAGGAVGLEEHIQAAAAKYGVPADALRRIAELESSFGKNNVSPYSSARGPFQITAGTWKEYGQGKDVMDFAANTDAAARIWRDRYNYTKKKLGREVSPWEVYVAHQQGAGGSVAHFRNPEGNAIQNLISMGVSPKVARQSVVNNGGREDMTSAEFTSRWMNKYNKDNGSVAMASAPPPTSAPTINNATLVDPSAVATSQPPSNQITPEMMVQAFTGVDSSSNPLLQGFNVGEKKDQTATGAYGILKNMQSQRNQQLKQMHDKASSQSVASANMDLERRRAKAREELNAYMSRQNNRART